MPRDIDEQLDKHLADAHSIEEQALIQMRLAPRPAGGAAVDGLHGAPGRDRAPRAARARAAGGPRREPVALQGPRDEGGRRRLRALRQVPARHARQAHRARLLLRAPGTRVLRAAAARRRARRRRADRRRRARDPRRGARDGRAPARLLRRRGRCLAGGRRRPRPREPPGLLPRRRARDREPGDRPSRARDLAGDEELARPYSEHPEESRRHRELIEERLRAHDRGPSRLKDAALRAGAINWGSFFQAHPDTPGKLVAFACAFEHLEIGGYEQLLRVARRAGDEATVAVVETILAEERAAAEKLAGAFDRAAELALEVQGASG